ncbi:Small subunit processome component 20 -like protein [Trichinella pseudospiralis]|uniref:Small subunit processome component 20-like protein n=1 Tax=Trichinella pseudospiralis TaxID=6337 RepID=A0A0V1EKC9_TRIPS|nr:Small subunit processome component 20 -like protein [Trichinella pseudospiralis]
MKHHKSGNKFRFIGFNERIKNIHVDITRQCRSFETAPDDEETFFAQTLAKQSELNYSKEFSDFLHDISTLAINTYPLLIFHKDEILRKLKKHLLEKNLNSISSLLELCIAICRDLHDEFQPHFWEIFEIISDILSVYNDPDVLEACFSTLAYLLKFSWRRMINNSTDVFQHFQHLLSHTKEYIRRFSAEALVFFIRKAADFGNIVEYCLRKIDEDNALLLGMAEVFIQCIIGPQNNFHGKAKKVRNVHVAHMMQTLLSFVHIPSLKETAFALLCQVNIALAQHAVVDTAATIFDCILDEGNCFFNNLRNDSAALDFKVAHLMDLTSVWIEMKQGCLVPLETKEKIVKNWLMQLISGNGGTLEWKIFNSFINLGSKIFQSPDMRIKCTILGDFLNLLVDVGAQFEHAVLIMPDSLFAVEAYQCRIIRFFALYTDRYLIENEIFKNCRLLASLCKMSSLTEAYAVGNGQWPLAARRLFFLLQKGRIVNLLDLIFSKFCEQLALTGSDKCQIEILLPYLICAALIYPMVTMDRDEHAALANVTKSLALSSLVVSKEYSLALRCLFKAVHQVKESAKLSETVICLAEHMLANLHTGTGVTFYLEATVSCVEYLNGRLSNFDLQMDVIELACRVAISNLWLPDVGTRVLSLRLLRHLCTLSKCWVGVDFADLCLEAESVPATIHQYRQRLLVYMKICSLCKSASEEKKKKKKEEEEEQEVLGNWSLTVLVLRFLVGQLHVNLSLLWNHVIETVETTMLQMTNDADQCWTVLVEALQFGTANLANNASEQCSVQVDSLQFRDEVLSLTINDRLVGQENCREDFVNFRHLVWLALEKLATSCPAPSDQVKRIVDSALSWFNVEYQYNDMNTIWFDCSRVTLLCDNDDELGRPTTNGRQKDSSMKLQLKTAVAILNTLWKLSKNHRQLVVRLQSVCTRLLRQTKREVQLAALNCMLGIMDDDLEAYRPHLSCLLTGDNFPDKLIKLAYRFDQLAVEEAGRRRHLATVLLNLVYGLLRSKGSANLRHLPQLFAFLGYCNSDELSEFLHLLISPIGCRMQQCNVERTIQALGSVFDGRTVVDLRHGVLGEIVEFLNQTMENVVANRVDEKCQRQIFHAALILQAVVNWIQLAGDNDDDDGQENENSQTEVPNDNAKDDHLWRKRGKKIRKQLQGFFVKFCTKFGEYPFSNVELKLLFKLVVWPALADSRPGDAIAGSLCKLFVVWSESELLWPLLYCSQLCDRSPLDCLLSTLGNVKAPAAVHRCAIDLVDGLLKMATDSKPNGQWTNSLWPIDNFVQEHWHVVDGQHLQPDHFVEKYAQAIITYCKEDVDSSEHRRPIDERKLDILCRLCDRLNVGNACASSLIASLFEQLQFRATEREDEEVLLILLSALLRLLKHSDDTLQYLDHLVNLYSTVRQRSVRTCLQEVFTVIVAGDAEYEKLCQIINGLNSWNKRQFEELDYDRRLAAHQQANNFMYEISKRALKPTLTVLLYNCFYFIELVEDLSLRNNAAHTVEQCLHCMSTRLGQDEWNSILNNSVLPYLRNAMKNKNDIIRNSFVGILRSCVLKFAIFHDQLKPLLQLVDNLDLELDFFENIRHIQLHRRARALRRLCDQLDGSPPSSSDPDTTIRAQQIRLYILPLISAYLSDEAFRNKHPSLIDECVRLIGCYCRLANWTSYSCILRKYLHKLKIDLDNQKLLTRIVVSILDSFHFNLNLPWSQRRRQIAESLSKTILPKLKAALICAGIHQVDKVMHRRRAAKLKLSNETDELIRVPIALAMIKLLIKLPAQIASSDISSTILKVCNMLKSRWLEVRNLARRTLCSMLNSLGSAYLAVVLKELRGTLNRGFQMHVLCYTVHVVLEMTIAVENFQQHALDAASLRDILEICRAELFGSVAEEKRVKEVLRRVWEAKAVKVFNTYAIIGRFVSKHNLFDVLTPLKEVLKQSPNHETLKKVSNCLKQFALGVSKNSNLTVETLMVFCYQVLNDGLQPLCKNDCQEQQQIENGGKSLRPVHSFLLPPEPGRRGFAVKVSKRTNMHLLISFALDVLLSLLRAGKLSAVESESLSLLDPFVDNLILCLNAAYPKIINVALRCLTNIVKYPLVSLEKNIDSLVKTVFTLLQNYACLGDACRGDSQDVLRNCFKLITAVIVYTGGKAVNAEQMDILLCYSEQDLADTQKQATAFSVVKAIFAKRHYSGTVEAILSKLQNLSITSGLEHVRVQCRQAVGVFFKFNCKKKSKKKQQLFVKTVEFYCVQLNYAEESGRVSALEMLEMLLSMTKSNLLPKIDMVVFLHLSARLQIDQSERCRNIIALAIKKLISRVSKEKFTEMFNVTLDWLVEDEDCCRLKIALKQTGALCLSLLFDESRAELVEKLPIIMKMIFSQFQRYLVFTGAENSADADQKNNGKEVTLQKSTSDNRCIDHFLFTLLNLCQKIIKAVPLDDHNLTCQWLPFRETLIEILLKTLLYPHIWVRTSASQLLGCCLLYIANDKSAGESDRWNSVLFEFCEKLFEQLKMHHNNEELIEQSVKNLVFIAKQTFDYNIASDQPKQKAQREAMKEGTGAKKTFCLSWMIKRLIRLSRMELVKNAKLSILRSFVFKWIAAIALQCNDTTLRNNLHTFLPVLYRELTVADNDENLKILSANVCEIVQNRVGLDAFSTEWNRCQSFAAKKRLERKRRLAAEALSDPVEAAKRRIKRQKLKIIAKKKRRTTPRNKPHSSSNNGHFEMLVEHETFE